ncbi:MAG: hypothetical protein ACLQPV_03215 [Vulcanimicrobiaceae bacterium]
MKPLRAVYEFVTGGSIVAPAGLAVALLFARFGALWLIAILAVTLVASTFEAP